MQPPQDPPVATPAAYAGAAAAAAPGMWTLRVQLILGRRPQGIWAGVHGSKRAKPEYIGLGVHGIWAWGAAHRRDTEALRHIGVGWGGF